jgi:hypothetical protein
MKRTLGQLAVLTVAAILPAQGGCQQLNGKIENQRYISPDTAWSIDFGTPKASLFIPKAGATTDEVHGPSTIVKFASSRGQFRRIDATRLTESDIAEIGAAGRQAALQGYFEGQVIPNLKKLDPNPEVLVQRVVPGVKDDAVFAVVRFPSVTSGWAKWKDGKGVYFAKLEAIWAFAVFFDPPFIFLVMVEDPVHPEVEPRDIAQERRSSRHFDQLEAASIDFVRRVRVR